MAWNPINGVTDALRSRYYPRQLSKPARCRYRRPSVFGEKRQ